MPPPPNLAASLKLPPLNNYASPYAFVFPPDGVHNYSNVSGQNKKLILAGRTKRGSFGSL